MYLSNGNTNIKNSGSQWRVVPATVGMSSGKYYWEIQISGSGTYSMVGIATASYSTTAGYTGFPLAVTSTTKGAYMLARDGYKYSGAGGRQAYTTTWASGDRLGVAFDADNGFVYVSKNGTWYASSDPTSGATGTGAMFGSLTDLPYYPASHIYTGYSHQYYFKEDDWSASAPTGYSAVQNSTALAADTTRTASDTNKYFQTTLYEGNGAGQRVGAFQPFDNTFTVAKSGLSIRASNQYLSRTPSSTGNTQKGTFSAWLKRTIPTAGGYDYIFTARISNTQMFNIYFTNLNALHVSNYSSGYDWRLIPTQVYTDTSQWMHICVAVDTTLGTSADRAILYVNGVRETVFSTETQPSLNFANDFNTASVPNNIGAFSGSAGVETDGYLAEVVWIDGTQYAASDFGQTDTSTNRWIPKDVSGLTFGTNGFYLNYAASGDIGNDVSGNNNDFTNNNGIVQSTDSPTTNIATFNPNSKASGMVLSNGNRKFVAGTNQNVHGTLALPSTGKYYWEVNLDTASSGSIGVFLALNGGTEAMTTATSGWGTAVALYRAANGNVLVDGTSIFTISGVSAINTTWQVAVDLDNNKMWFGIDNTWMSSTAITGGNPSTGANPVLERDFTGYFPLFGNYSNTMTVDFASADWGYTPPTGFVELSQDNLAGTDQFISAFSWIKNRDATDNHMLFDRVRGATKDIHSNDAAAEVTNVNTLQSFLEAGAQIGNDVEVNTTNESYVLWNWMMEQTGSGASNEDGTINTTATLVDQTLGMSISTYTGTGANATIGHGLGVAPTFVIIKRYNSAGHNWIVGVNDGSGSADFTDRGILQLTQAFTDSATEFNDTNPTSSVISLGSSGDTNSSSQPHICYAFASSQFISIGSYNGNANANGAFVPTINSLGIPIQPVWAITKSIDTTSDWNMYDKKRLGYNPENAHLVSNSNVVESTDDDLDIVTGGLKMRITGKPNSANTYIYMAIGTPMIDTDGRIIAGR